MILDFPLPSFPATQESGAPWLGVIPSNRTPRRDSCEVSPRPEVNEVGRPPNFVLSLWLSFAVFVLGAHELPNNRISNELLPVRYCSLSILTCCPVS
jgi:hypothetical protein